MGKRTARFFTMALAALTGCTFFEPAEMYGVPYSTYRLGGSVTDRDGTPIPGINVTVTPYGNNIESADAVTDAKGKFSVDAEFTGPVGTKVKVEFLDVDGQDNGGMFLQESVDVGTRLVEDPDRWYVGGWESDDVDVTMKRSGEDE